MSVEEYIIAYQREKKARIHAEELLESKSRELYYINQAIQSEHEHLVQTEKMASLGQLAAGAAHEINNPVGFALSNLDTLAEYIDKIRGLKDFLGNEEGESKETVKNYLKEHNINFIFDDISPLLSETQEGLRRVKKIVAGLREFTHQGSEKATFCDVHSLIDSSVRTLNHVFENKCEVVKIYGEIPFVNCFPEQLNQVFINVLHNASQAIEGKGRITIETITENNEVVVRITDTGGGIKPEVLSSIFTPFFTTKPVGVGTGLGLSVTYGIIKRHNGSIVVENSTKDGTTFRISLPIDAKLKTINEVLSKKHAEKPTVS